MAKKKSKNNTLLITSKFKPDYNVTSKTTAQIQSDFNDPRSSSIKRNNILQALMYHLYKYRMETNPNTATLQRIVDFQYLLKELPKKLNSQLFQAPPYQVNQVKQSSQIQLHDTVQISTLASLNNTCSETLIASIEPNITTEIISLNNNNIYSIVGIARKLGKPCSVVYRILRENGLLISNPKDSIWYKEVNIPAELRLLLKKENITFGLWCRSLRISPINFAKSLEARLNCSFESDEMDFAYDALNNDFPDFMKSKSKMETTYKKTDVSNQLTKSSEVPIRPHLISDPLVDEPVYSFEHKKFSYGDFKPKVYPLELLSSPLIPERELLTKLIKGVLNKCGLCNPCRVADEVNAISDKPYPIDSIEKLLLTENEFIRYAPNLYGLNEYLNGFGISTSDLLLNEYDCKLYVMARYAGEHFGAFYLWTAAMEYRWYQWLQTVPSSELRESFYYIAKPEEWPVNAKSSQEFKDKIEQQSDSYYFLREPKYYDYSLPEIRSLYALIRYVKATGSINWISANRLLGRKIDDFSTAVDMALLVCFGVVEPAYNWQSNHLGKDANEIENSIVMMLTTDTDCTWHGRTGQFLIDILTININTIEMGWVNISSVNNLFHSSSKKNADLISEEYLVEPPVEIKLAVPPIQEVMLPSEKNISDLSVKLVPVRDENTDSLLRALAIALNPENLVSDELWLDWSKLLNDHGIASEFISTVAERYRLSWPGIKQFEQFDKYLGLSLNTTIKMLGWRYHRTLLLCVANLSLTLSENMEVSNLKEAHKTDLSTKADEDISFEKLYRATDPIALLKNETWDKWTRLLSEHHDRTIFIADIVDELGSLFWQARWKNEKISDYCHYSLDKLRNLEFPGKNRTIVICVAKVATDTLAHYAHDKNRVSTFKKTEKVVASGYSKSQYPARSINNKEGNILDSIIEDFF